LSCLALALPLSPERRDDSSLSHISRDLGEEFPLFQRDVDSTFLEARAEPKAGFHRVAVTPEQRKARKAVQHTAKAGRVATAKAKGKDRANHRPANAKVTFGADAKRKLDELGLHGKSRKHAKNYHKNIVKAEMKGHGAETARVFHLAHKGGSDPNEKNHLTVGLYNKKGDQIKSPWALKKEAETGQATKGLFHMYPEKNPKFKEPKSFTVAAEKSQERQKVAAEEAAKAAATASKAEEDRKAAAAEKQRTAGKSLSTEEKQALRKAKKEAKKP